MSQFKKGISLVSEYPDSITYKCECDCSSKECSTTIDFEFDKNSDMVYLRFYKQLCTFDYWHFRKTSKQKIFYFLPDLISKYFNRLKKCFKLLSTGYLSMEETLILRDDGHLDNFITALIEGKTLMEKRKQEKKSKDI